MTKKDIEDFVAKLSKKKNTSVRQKGSSTNPTTEFNFRNSNSKYAAQVELDYGDHTDFYEFENSYKVSDLNSQITKWIMLSIKVKELSGQLYLVVDEKHKFKYQKIVKSKDLDINVLSI